jgi:pyroglutamyl-peptidase
MADPLILLTGFEPFNGASLNPSAEVVWTLADEGSIGLRLHTAVLPVVSQAATERFNQLLDDLQPDAILCLGEARGRSALNVEQMAANELNFRIPDNSGVTITNQPIIADGPVSYPSTFPAQAIRDAIRDRGIPAILSTDAGRYLCNQVLYQSLHWVACHRPATLAGFIHLPSLPQQMAQVENPLPTMALALQVEAVHAALVVLSETVNSRTIASLAS